MDKAATTGSARSFGAAVGAKTKEFINGSAGSELSGTSRDENLPSSKFQPKYESPKEQADKNSLGHPVRPDGESVAEMVKEAAHRCALRKALTKDKPWEELCVRNLEKQAGVGSAIKTVGKKSWDFMGPTGTAGTLGGAYASQDIDNPAVRTALTLLPGVLASKGRGRSIGEGHMRKYKGAKGLAPEARAKAVKAQLLGGMAGIGAGGGLSKIYQLSNLAHSDKGQDAITSIIQTSDALREAAKTTTGTAKEMGKTLKGTAEDVSRSANFWTDFGKHIQKESEPIIDFINKHKGKFAIGSAGLLATIMYNRYKKAKEAEANAEFVKAMMEKAEKGRSRR